MRKLDGTWPTGHLFKRYREISERSLTLQKVVLNGKQWDPEGILKDLWRRS